VSTAHPDPSPVDATPVGPAPVHRRRPGPVDLGLPVAAALYLVLACLPWVGLDFLTGRASASGLRYSGLVVAGAVLLVAAAVWTVLPAVRAGRLRSARHAVGAGLTGAAVLLTLVAWLRSLDLGFRPAAFLALLVAVAALALCGHALRGELAAVPGPPAAAQQGGPGAVGEPAPAARAVPGALPAEVPYTGPPATVLPPGTRYPLPLLGSLPEEPAPGSPPPGAPGQQPVEPVPDGR